MFVYVYVFVCACVCACVCMDACIQLSAHLVVLHASLCSSSLMASSSRPEKDLPRGSSSSAKTPILLQMASAVA